MKVQCSQQVDFTATISMQEIMDELESRDYTAEENWRFKMQFVNEAFRILSDIGPEILENYKGDPEPIKNNLREKWAKWMEYLQ